MSKTDPLAQVSTRRPQATPQSEAADPRQVRNSAGGYTFTTGRAERLHRFLTLGTEGGTYYASEKAITKENAQVVLDLARSDATLLAIAARDVSVAGRAPRNNPAIFALAAAASLGDDNGRRLALSYLPEVCRIGTHLYLWCNYVGQFRGWGRGLRHAVSSWYLEKDPDALAYQLVKYRQREGWTHRDVLRSAHPKFTSPAHRALADWLCLRDAGSDALPEIAQAFIAAQHADKPAQWVQLIRAVKGMTWEMLPTAALSSPDVWEALLAAGMPQGALLRQLPRLTRLGVLNQTGWVAELVARQLTDTDRILKARIHPMSVLLAAKTYAGGRSLRGGYAAPVSRRGSRPIGGSYAVVPAEEDGSWVPVSRVIDALDAMFYAAYGTVVPARKRTNVALDVSGSMGSPVGGMPMSCREASVALALVTAATEPQTVITGFTAGRGTGSWSSPGGGRRYYGGGNDGITPLSISPRQRLDDAVRAVKELPFGGTDCSLPMLWALRNGVEAEHFSVYTDNETWAGQMHPHQALDLYRRETGIPARMSVIAMTATEFTIADPLDPGSLDVSGFDSAVPKMLADFARGDI